MVLLAAGLCKLTYEDNHGNDTESRYLKDNSNVVNIEIFSLELNKKTLSQRRVLPFCHCGDRWHSYSNSVPF